MVSLSDIIWGYVTIFFVIIQFMAVPFVLCFAIKKAYKGDMDEETQKDIFKFRDTARKTTLVIFFIIVGLVFLSAIQNGVFSHMKIEEMWTTVGLSAFGFALVYLSLFFIRKFVENIAECLMIYQKKGSPWSLQQESSNHDTYDWKQQEQHKRFLQTMADKERQAEDDYAGNVTRSTHKTPSDGQQQKPVVYSDKVYQPVVPPKNIESEPYNPAVMPKSKPKIQKRKTEPNPAPAQTKHTVPTDDEYSIIGGYENETISENETASDQILPADDVFVTSSFDGMTTNFDTSSDADWN